MVEGEDKSSITFNKEKNNEFLITGDICPKKCFVGHKLALILIAINCDKLEVSSFFSCNDMTVSNIFI